MDYITAIEAAEKWSISKRRVTKLCAEGRVEGAQKFSSIWAIPAGAAKPTDERITSGKYLAKKKTSTEE